MPRSIFLIQRGLSAKLRRRVGERLLNLKDLLDVLSPGLESLFENEPLFECCFLCRSGPNSAIFRQKRADNGRKWRSFATDFVRTAVAWEAVKELNTETQRHRERVRRLHEMSFISRRLSFFSVSLCLCVGSSLAIISHLLFGGREPSQRAPKNQAAGREDDKSLTHFEAVKELNTEAQRHGEE